jgi:ankyrin repeat protein
MNSFPENEKLSENEKNLIKTIFDNDFNEFKRIIELSLDPNIINIVDHDCGSSLINFACSEGRLKFVEYLIEKGVDVNGDCYGQTAFESAWHSIDYNNFPITISDVVNIDILRLLLQHGVSPIEDFEDILYTEKETEIIQSIMNENYSVKPCCK